jgi:hypothetical protein
MVESDKKVFGLIREHFMIVAMEHFAVGPYGRVDIICHEMRINKSINKLPFTFGDHFKGYLDLCGAGLVTLEGCPKQIVGAFACGRNQLISLKGGPDSISFPEDDKYGYDGYRCFDNRLLALDHLPNNTYSFGFTWNNVLPLLRLISLGIHFITVDGNDIIQDIIEKVVEMDAPVKQRLWEFQSKLIAAGFEDNARW